MILVADSGSTKCDWVVSNNYGKPIHKIQTSGLNPLVYTATQLQKIIENSAVLFQYKERIKQVHFYGAGCNSPRTIKIIKKVLRSLFINSTAITVQEDIIAAVHAVTTKPAVVCILGTGSNSCFYDGNTIIQRVPALGYILADEGSGNYFGKKILKDYYFKKMPIAIAHSFEQRCSPVLDTILSTIHTSTNPSKYLATYARFLFEHRGNHYIENLIEQGVDEFLNLYVMPYKKELEQYPIHFVGSIAYTIQDIIKQQFTALDFDVQTFIKSPITKLTSQIISKGI